MKLIESQRRGLEMDARYYKPFLAAIAGIMVFFLTMEPVVFAENSLTPKLQYIENMLTGSSTDDERMIMDNKALLEALPKPAKGEKKAAREANDEALVFREWEITNIPS